MSRERVEGREEGGRTESRRGGGRPTFKEEEETEKGIVEVPMGVASVAKTRSDCERESDEEKTSLVGKKVNPVLGSGTSVKDEKRGSFPES